MLSYLDSFAFYVFLFVSQKSRAYAQAHIGDPFNRQFLFIIVPKSNQFN